jgi:hypothetical protein
MNNHGFNNDFGLFASIEDENLRNDIGKEISRQDCW